MWQERRTFATELPDNGFRTDRATETLYIMYARYILLLLFMWAGTAFASQPGKRLPEWKSGTVLSAREISTLGIERCFSSEPIPDPVFRRMKGKTFRPNPTIKRESLRYLRLLHVDSDGKTRMGEMVCNKAIAADLVSIFRKLYDAHYPIQRIALLDDYDADDERAMGDNNTSCFCYRTATGSKKLSAHARGMAVDVNTFYNPYVRKTRSGKLIVHPAGAERYADRTKKFNYKIDTSDLCYRLFRAHGFKWGGAWRSCKDYQHFEK